MTDASLATLQAAPADPAGPADPHAHLPRPPKDEIGLTQAEAAERLATHGANLLVPAKRRGRLFAWLLKPLSDPMAILLLVAAPTYVFLGDVPDAIIAFIALVPIVAVGWVLEARAEQALEKLRRMTEPSVPVWREGRYHTIPSEELVPGDLYAVHEGDVVAADAELVKTTQMMVDESALTGESLPVSKAAVGEDRELLAGTTVLSGRGVARVVTTGIATRYGKIGSLVAAIKQPPTPLQRLVGQLVKWLGVLAIVMCSAVVIVELARGGSLGTAVIAGVSLAIAAIPEEFPMVYTLYLALGAWRLAQDRALVRRLAGVETLGSTTVICSDKTGTLTLGELKVWGTVSDSGTIASADEPDAAAGDILRAAVLASEPRPFDPLEKAILASASERGVDPEALHAGTLAVDHPFDPHHKYLSHVWAHDGHHTVAAKGSIEGILAHSRATDAQRAAAHEANERLAGQGMRVLAVAFGDIDAPTGDRAADEAVLEFRGLVAFSDPLRPGVLAALDECRAAGIRVIMITGDHPATAHAVAEGLGLPHADASGEDVIATGDDLDRASDTELDELVRHANVFARTRPEQKHRLVAALRSQGHVVAMTGDGINDAPALREADLGVAMGLRGTEVARESATLVLLDDNFATIVGAVRNGRRIFDNLKRAFAYLVGFHPPLLIGAFVVPLLGQPLLLFPIHLVLLELIVHPTVSLVFEADPAEEGIMARKPRDKNAGLIGAELIGPFVLGLTLAVATVGTYLFGLGQGYAEAEARALAFAVMLIGQTLLILVVRATGRSILNVGFRTNRMLAPILAGSVAVLLASVYLPPLAGILHFAPFPVVGWVGAALIAGAATLWLQPLKLLRPARRPM